tara:strand:+ start:4801 stop:5157 length:357 start_codon:yes stop_codon:yes gene_type:complete
MPDSLQDLRSSSSPPAATVVGTFEPALEKLRKFRDEKAETAKMIADLQRQTIEINALWNDVGGCRKAGLGSVALQLAKRHGPRILAWIGGPGAGAAVVALAADDGAFSRFAEMLSQLF